MGLFVILLALFCCMVEPQSIIDLTLNFAASGTGLYIEARWCCHFITLFIWVFRVFPKETVFLEILLCEQKHKFFLIFRFHTAFDNELSSKLYQKLKNFLNYIVISFSAK